MEPGTPVCCGSDALRPNSTLTNTGNFTRSSVGGAFQVQVNISGSDVTPPARVTDLAAVYTDPEMGDFEVRLTFTAPGDNLDSEEPARSFLIKYAASADNLTSQNFDSVTTILSEQDLMDGTTLDPPAGGRTVSLLVRPDLFPPDTQHYFAMRANDSAGNWSPISKVARLFYNSKGDITPPSAVNDLSVVENNTVILQFTAPGDDLDTATNASVFLIRYSRNSSDLSENFNTSNAVTITQDDLVGGSLIPPMGGETVTINLSREDFLDSELYYFALKTKDHSDNWSELSNMVKFMVASGAPVKTASAVFIVFNLITCYLLL